MRLVAFIPTFVLLAGCASGGGTTDPGLRDPVLEVRLTFADRVNPSRFNYFLIFNVQDDESQVPQVDLNGFEDRDEIGVGWDVYYVYGTPGGLGTGFYRGRGGTASGGRPLPDANGDLHILKLPQPANGPEILQAAVVAGSTDPNNPSDPGETANTILYRFDLEDFPSVPGLTDNPVHLRMAVLVTDRGIDNIENPDDGDINDVQMYDRFFESHVVIDLAERDEVSERTDPQEFIEEAKPNRVPPLTAAYRAADLVNWSVREIR
ncbi:MAG TPA: hypothetical protein VEI97_09460 [bacterium]|nr:hypothetical protein [bacterium]